MYQIFIETSLDDLLIILLKNHQTLDAVHKKNLIQKSEVLPQEFENLLNKYHLKTTDIQAFYLTLGPGSFMGSRVSLMFCKTICQITKAKLYTINTLMWISQGQTGTYYIDAKSNQSYQGVIKNQIIKQTLVPFMPNTKLNYQNLIQNFTNILNLFKLETDLLLIKPNYLKDPKVG